MITNPLYWIKRCPPKPTKAEPSWNIKKANWYLFKKISDENVGKITLTDKLDKNAKEWKKNHSDYSIEREQQKTIFRLRTGHGCLRAHLHKQGEKDSPYCNCGPVAQTPHHVLQDCPLLDGLREEIWPTPTSIETKLWDSGREELQKTSTFLKRALINT